MATTPNMGLTAPSIGVTPAPDWAQQVNQDLSLIDAHDHSPGNGAPLSVDSINITADLPFNNNNLTLVKSVRFSPQGSPLGGGSDIGCLYEAGVDLYYNDGNGNQIRMTQAGSIAGASGNITGLVSPASASFNAGSGTFIWQKDSAKAANMDMASAIIRKFNVTSSPGITISAPSSLSSSYTFTLPVAPPPAPYALVMDSSGNVTTNDNTLITALDATAVTATTVVADTVEATTGIWPSSTMQAQIISNNYLAIRINNGQTLANSYPVVTAGALAAPWIISGTVDDAANIITGGGFTAAVGPSIGGRTVIQIRYTTHTASVPTVVVGNNYTTGALLQSPGVVNGTQSVNGFDIIMSATVATNLASFYSIGERLV